MLTPVNNQQKDYQLVTDVQALNGLKQTAKKDQAEALRPVAEQFEALFINQIMKEARKVKLDDGWLDGGQSDFYKQWYDQQLSQVLSTKGSLGLADLIVKQLSPQLPHSAEKFAKMGSETEEPVATLAESKNNNKVPKTADHLAFRVLQQK